MNHEEKWIHSFKGIAILGIILIHFGCHDIDNKVFFLFTYCGAKGVQIFLLISSYLVFLSLNKNNIQTIRQAFNWILRKFLRLMPLYYFALIIHLLVLGFGDRYWLGSIPSISITNIVSHLLFLHGLNPYYFNSIISVEWYLGVLAFLYLLAPLLHKLIKNLKSAVCFFLVSLILCNYITRLQGLQVIQDSYIWDYYIENYNFIVQLPVILFGVVLYFLFQHPIITELKGNKAFSCFLLLFSLFVIYRLLRGSTFYGFAPYGLWAMALGGIIASQVIYPTKIICNKFFDFIGKYSYGIYLFHYLLIMKLPAIPIGNIYLSWIVNYATILTLSLLLSIILNYCIEKPFMKLINKKKAIAH